jgi:glycine/D-amino acid oxidase-like deaminating enzyme
MRSIMDTVDVIGRTIEDEQIDCGFTKGGVIRLARTSSQLERQRDEVALFESCDLDDELALLGPTDATDRLNATDTLGAIHYRPCARIDPARLVHGLAAAVERLGGTIVVGTRVTGIRVGAGKPTVVTDRGRVTADVVVRATEAYTRDLPGLRRQLVPLYSLMIATEPLPPELWDEIGLREFETFCDDRRMVIYGQRTPDDRIAFGGRGARYGFGSRIDPSMEQGSAEHDRIEGAMRELLPMLGHAAITHRWGGVLGVPRDWRPSVGFDTATGVAWAGGYVGEGVAAANLAGRTLADLITGSASDLNTLAWVDHPSRRWEPEPLRWLGINGSIGLAARADRAESGSGRPSRLGSLVDRLTH